MYSTSIRFQVVCGNHVECLESAQQHGSQHSDGNGGRASEWGHWAPRRLLARLWPLKTSTALTFPFSMAVSVDAAIETNGTRCSIVLIVFCVPLARCFSLLVAEGMAVWVHGLRKALDEGVKKVVIQSDCEVTVNLFKTKTVLTTNVDLIIEDIFCVLSCFCWSEVVLCA